MNSLLPRKQANAYTWTFFRAGGVDQVDIAKPSDLENLEALDPKLWIALACPTKGLELDARTLELIDTDKDGRIRTVELLAAVAWCKEAFAKLDVLFAEGDAVPLDAISTSTQVGKDLLAGARRILANLGKSEAAAISLPDVANTEAIFAGTRLNGDGIVPVAAAESESAKQLIADIIASCGSVKDRGGEPGVDQPRVDAFAADIQKLADFYARGDAPEVRPLGGATEAAFEAFTKVRAKIDDFFTRCRLLGYDERLVLPASADDPLASTLRARALSSSDPDLVSLPVAKANRERLLSFDADLNPAWALSMTAFRTAVVVPVLGETRSLDESGWARIVATFAAFEAWTKSKPTTSVEGLGESRVRAIASEEGRTWVAALTALIKEDAALASESSQIENIERMIRFRRDIVRLLRNFVSFGEFYRTRKAIFQAGRLYVDGRACDLCLLVEDVGKHATLAALAQSYLVYAECRRMKPAEGGAPAVAEKQTIVAIVTAGGVDNLMVGRNGMFFDRHGGNWDATVTKVIENPIDVSQAFFAPYKRFLRLIQEQVAKRAAAASEENNKALASHADEVASADKAAALPAAEAAPHAKKIDIGTVAALGVAVGGIATFFSSVFAMFLGLGMWMPFGILALVLGISGPSMLIAWLKLRQRNIGPILDASGWAVNAFARINVNFGSALTSVAVLPPGAIRTLHDPFADKQRPWRLYVALLVLFTLLLVWFGGRVDVYLPDRVKASTVLHRAPPPEPHK